MSKTTVMVLLDYSKAFDTISHELLLAILLYMGFSEESVGMIESYLSDRSQFVQIGTVVSPRGSIMRGVPQGTILGPLLFSIYTAKIASRLGRCASYLYADDTQLSFSFFSSDVDRANEIINEEISSLVEISYKHDLVINPSKSFVMVFGTNREAVESSLKIKINGVEITSVRTARNLGVEFDVELRFKKYVTRVLQKAYLNLKMLYPHRHILDKSLKRKLTDALVLSHFNYCDVLYGPCLDAADTAKIQRVQKQCLRFIYGIRKFDRISYKLHEARWLNMETRRKYHALTLYHSIINYKCPPYLYEKVQFRTDVHNLNLRHKGLISPPYHKTALFQRSFTYNIYKLYNGIDKCFRDLPVHSFKSHLKRHLLDQQC